MVHLAAAVANPPGRAFAQAPVAADPKAVLVRMDTSLPDYSSFYGGAEGRAAQNTEIEPHVAASPADPDHLVAAWQQNRVSGKSGGAQTIRVGVSRDGGRRCARLRSRA